MRIAKNILNKSTWFVFPVAKKGPFAIGKIQISSLPYWIMIYIVFSVPKLRLLNFFQLIFDNISHPFSFMVLYPSIRDNLLKNRV